MVPGLARTASTTAARAHPRPGYSPSSSYLIQCAEHETTDSFAPSSMCPVASASLSSNLLQRTSLKIIARDAYLPFDKDDSKRNGS